MYIEVALELELVESELKLQAGTAISGDSVQATHLPPHVCRGQLQERVSSVCLYKEGTKGMRPKLCSRPGVWCRV